MEKVFIIGGTTFDHIVYLEELPGIIPKTIHEAPFQEGIGSTGAGKALNLTKIGVGTIFYSVIGDDVYGKLILQNLEENKVDFFYDIDPKGTERHINIMDENGQRISIFITQSSSRIDFDLLKIENALQQSDVYVLNIIGYCRNLIPLVQKYNKPVWTDLHDYDGINDYHNDFINAAQYIHFSSDNVEDYLSTMQHFITLGKKLVICTHGKKGATLLSKGGILIEQPALLQNKMVDANGAGDSFFSGFLYGWLKKEPLQKCMIFGAICAGMCINSAYLASELLNENSLLLAYEKMQKKIN